MSKKASKCVEGMDYPKKKILALMEIFGLVIDYDQWDVEDKGWLRIRWGRDRDSRNLIIHKHHLEVQVHREEEHLKALFQNYLIEMGETEFKKKLNDLIKID